MSETANIRFGGADLFMNGVNVGYLSGDVTLTYRRSGFKMSPSGSSSQNLIAIGQAKLKAAAAEITCDNLRLALGLGGSIETSTGSLSYNPASYDVATSSTSWQGLTIGRESVGTTKFALRVEHTKVNGKKVVLILYTALSVGNMDLPFGDGAVTLYDLEFVGVPDETRPQGDQIGLILEEV